MSKLLRIPAVLDLLGGISRPTFWRLRCSDSNFPSPVKITGSSLAFYQHEVEAWLKTRRASTVRLKFEEEEIPVVAPSAQPADPILLARLRAAVARRRAARGASMNALGESV